MSTVETKRRSRYIYQPAGKSLGAGHDGPNRRGPGRYRFGLLVALAIGVVAGVVMGLLWQGGGLPHVHDRMAAGESDCGHDEAAHGVSGLLPDDHGEGLSCGGHSHSGQQNTASIELTDQGRKNIGLKLVEIAPQDFQRTISIPAVLAIRPGITDSAVAAPMTGIVRRVYPIRGEAVAPGDPLFELRLTHEDIVEKQSALLRALEELDVVKQEVARLEDVTASGAVAGKRLLERQYDQRKIEAVVRAERQALILHGLTEDQVESIAGLRRLVQSFTIPAPDPTGCKSYDEHEAYLQVADLLVTTGQHVTAGTQLCTLVDHCELYIEGKAFESDADALNRAANEGLAVTALVKGNGSGKHEVTGLRVLYVENQVEKDSRALKFYVRMPNELVRNETTGDGHRFIGWRYKPGQRIECLVTVERWQNCIVLPTEAVVQDGAESYVYQQVAGQFDRTPVHVLHHDTRRAVIETDGTLFPGDTVAAQGAYQIHLALKNKAGGGVDPHAGHHH